MSNESKEKLTHQIQEQTKHWLETHQNSYCIDFKRSHLNDTKSCAFCQNPELSSDQLELLQQASLYKKNKGPPTTGHCFGWSLVFLQTVLSSPSIETDSCAEILYKMQQHEHLNRMVHFYSANQPTRYSLFADESAPSVIFDFESLKRYFDCLIHRTLVDYILIPMEEADPAGLNEASIYATLCALKNKLILSGVKAPNQEVHSIAIYNHSNRILLFDSNAGIYEYPNLEVLSYVLAKKFQGSELRCIETFSIEK